MRETSTLDLLRQVPLFADLDETSLQELARHSRRRKFGANEALFHEGDPGYTLYLILSGRIHIQKVSASGNLIHIAMRGPGEHLGELALIDGEPRMADAVTAEPSELLMLDRTHFLRCMETTPRMALAIMTFLAQRLRQAAQDTENQRELDVLGRVSQALLDLMQASGTPDPSGATRLDVQVTHQQLATQIGATRESVSRAISNLRAVGVLRNEGRTLYLLNAAKLRQYCGE